MANLLPVECIYSTRYDPAGEARSTAQAPPANRSGDAVARNGCAGVPRMRQIPNDSWDFLAGLIDRTNMAAISPIAARVKSWPQNWQFALAEIRLHVDEARSVCRAKYRGAAPFSW